MILLTSVSRFSHSWKKNKADALLSVSSVSSPAINCVFCFELQLLLSDHNVLRTSFSKNLQMRQNIFCTDMNKTCTILLYFFFIYIFQLSSGWSNRVGCQGQIPQWHKWKGVGGRHEEEEETDKGEGSKVRERRDEGERGRRMSGSDFFWQRFLNVSAVAPSNLGDIQSTWTSCDESSLINGRFHCLTTLFLCENPISSSPALPLSAFPPALPSHFYRLLWYVTHSFHYYSETQEESTLRGSASCRQSITLNVASPFNILCSGLFGDVFHSARRVPRTLLIKSAYREFLFKFTAENELQLSFVAVQQWEMLLLFGPGLQTIA